MKGGNNIFYYNLLKEKKYLESKIADIRIKLKKLPDENLCCAKNGNGYKWYSLSKDKPRYIYKKNRKYAEKLALKKYYVLFLQDLEDELKVVDLCLSKYPQEKQVNLLIEHEPEYMKLLSGHFVHSDSNTNSWIYEPYDRNNNYPEGLKFKTNSGIVVRSKSELIIANILSEYKIPFRYECSLNLGGIILYPDFTIMHPKTNHIFYWEHFGMIDNSNYANNTTNKLHTYIANNIYPSINLITSYETKENPLDVGLIEELVKYYFL